ncbi:fruit-body specific gene A, partial [Dendrothele bispora CBS 962.96]
PKPPPHHPPPPPSDGFTPTFLNLTGATQANDFLTFGLVDTVDDCKTMCLNVEGCAFINTYHDVNGKGGSPLLTCSLFGSCHGPDTATNVGGQSQPDGSLDFITNSDGYCKDQ